MSGKQADPKPVLTETASEKASDDVTATSETQDWVASGLKQLYRSTVEEGIPDDMMALLDALDDTEKSTDDKSSADTADDKAGDHQ